MASVPPHTKLEVRNLHEYKPIVDGARMVVIDGVHHLQGEHTSPNAGSLHAISSANPLFPGTWVLSEKGNANGYVPVKAPGALADQHIGIVYGNGALNVYAPKGINEEHLDRALSYVVPNLDKIHSSLTLGQPQAQAPPAGLIPLQPESAAPEAAAPAESYEEVNERFHDLSMAPRAKVAGGFPVC